MKCTKCGNETVGQPVPQPEGGYAAPIPICTQCEFAAAREAETRARQEDLPDPDDDDEDGTGTPDYYYCNGCGKDVTQKPPGCLCPRCGVIMEEQYF